MPLDFPSNPTNGQLYEGWVWDGSAWNYAGRSVGITTTSSPTTTTTTVAPAVPVVNLTAITQSNEVSLASFTGTYTGSGITETGFVQTPSETIPDWPNGAYFATGVTTSPFTFPGKSTNFANLSYWTAYAINQHGIGYSTTYPWAHIQKYASGPTGALAATRNGSNISCTFTFAAGEGNQLNSEVTAIGFIWSTTSTLPTFEGNNNSGSVASPVSQIPVSSPFQVTGTVTSSSAVYIRAYVRYGGEFYWYSLNSKFVPAATTTTTSTTSTTTSTTTTTIPPPSVTTQAATSISKFSATFNGTLVSTGGETLGTLGFVYDTSPNPTTGNSVVSAAPVLAGNPYSCIASFLLLPNTTYYVRAYLATFESGAYYGNQISFTTLPL